MDLSGLSAIAPGYLEGQQQQAQTANLQNTAQAPAALAALLQALGIQQGPAGLGQRMAPLAPPQMAPQQGPPPQQAPGRFDQMFQGNTDFNSMFSGNPGAPNAPFRGQPSQTTSLPPPTGGVAPVGQPAGQGGGNTVSPPAGAPSPPPNLPAATKQALYQMPLQDIVAAVKKGNPNIDDRTLGLGLQALSPFLNQEANRALAEQRMFYTNQLHELQQQNTEQRLDFARQRLDPGVRADLTGAGTAARIAAIEAPAAKEFLRLADNAIASSDQVPRESWKFINQVLQAGETQIGDPKLAGLQASLLGIINTYARAIAGAQGRGQTVYDKQHASQALSPATSPEAFRAAVQKLQYEVRVAAQEAERNLATKTGRQFNEAAPVDPTLEGAGQGTEIDDLVKKYGG